MTSKSWRAYPHQRYRWSTNLDKKWQQLLAVYTDPESHNLQRYEETDGRTDRQTRRWCQ